MDLNILYEDKDIIVVEKPSGVPSQKDRSRAADMTTLVSMHLQSISSQTKPYVGLVHRLDRPVSGIMVFAKTSYANASLSRQIQNKEMNKFYKVVVCGKPVHGSRAVTDYLAKQNNNTSIVVSEKDPKGKKAILQYDSIKTIDDPTYGTLSLLYVALITGRHHQIRVQLTNLGLPIWGDTKYNKDFQQREGWYQIALCAYRLEFKHPKTKKPLKFQIEATQYPFELFE